MNIKKILASLFITVFTLALTVTSAYAVNNYFNGFETDTDGWNDYLGSTVTRMPSGHNGITSADGNHHAVLGLGDLVSGGIYDGEKHGPYTDWGGYESTFPEDGYVTELDVYLDMGEADGVVDKRFDYSSAINNPDGNHRRDFIFHVGTDPNVPNRWVVSASNNAPGDPLNTDLHTAGVGSSGWYTLRHTFEDDGTGVLKVTMHLLNENGVIGTWILSDPTDVIGDTVGGNRYGWIVTNDFNELPVDNSRKENFITTPSSKEDCRDGGWMNLVDEEGNSFNNLGDCMGYVASDGRSHDNR